MDIRKTRYILPNLFTLASVFFGVLAMVSCLEGSDAGFRQAAIALLVAIVADGLDGRVARMTKTETRFGVQLDSLADVVSFGAAPAVLGYAFALRDLDAGSGLAGAFIAFSYVACGALRLARFNVLAETAKKPSPYFVGLPIPGAAGIVALLVWVATDHLLADASRTVWLAVAMPVLAALMISTVKYRNFKHVRLGLAARLCLLCGAAGAILLAFRTGASVMLLALALAYTALGPVEWLVRLVLRRPRRDGEKAERDTRM